MNDFVMPCGCVFKVLGPSPYKDDPLPLLDYDIHEVPYCPAVWEILARGLTAGVFQLESSLGKMYSRKLKPRSIGHINALVALLRPGCLDFLDEEGVSMTERYVRRANGEPTPAQHPVVDEILKDTFGIQVFQEDQMAIAGAVAAFDAGKRSALRKGVGKKLQDVIAAVGRDFMKGVLEQRVVSEELGLKLWGAIQAAGRYAFNKSHSLSYARISYWTAYIKAHDPLGFYTAWLGHAREKNQKWHEETAKLVLEAKLFDIEVQSPSFASLEPHAWTDGKQITLGLTEAKGVGVARFDAALKRIRLAEKTFGPASAWNWAKIVVQPSLFNAGDMTTLVKVGAFPDPKIPRRRKLAENDLVRSLTKIEQKSLLEAAQQQDFPPLVDLLEGLCKSKKDGGVCATEAKAEQLKGKLRLLKNPPAPLTDNPHFVASWEKEAFGIPLTCMKLDACDTSGVIHSVRDLLTGYTGTAAIGVEIQRLKEVKTKRGQSKGKMMAFLTVMDRTGEIDLVCFAEEFEKYQNLLRAGNNVLVRCKRDRDKDGAIVERILQLT